MPELPEVEAVVRKLRRSATGARIAGFQAFRARATHPQTAEHVEGSVGRSIVRFERRGKHIVVRLDGGVALDVHLKMSGNLTVIPDARMHALTVRAVFALSDGRGLVLDDPRMLGHVNLFTNQELEQRLGSIGIDPLSPEFTPEFLAAAAKRSAKPVKIFLTDQKPLAGLGNIYAAEALFRARVDPARQAARLSKQKIRALHESIGAVLAEAVPAAVRSYRNPGNHEGMHYRVYDREGEPCITCGRPIGRMVQAGRSTYFCPRCQK